MKKSCPLLAALALCAATSARADLKDPLPDSLSLGGVTLYGTIDVGYAYQTHGVPLNAQFPFGLEYQTLTTTRNFAGSVSTLAQSGLEVSKVGIRVEQPIGNDWSLVSRVETGINPLSGQLMNACASIVQNAGKTQGNQTANADSSRCGQLFQGPAYGGLLNSGYGQLTIGRHDTLQSDALFLYDPQDRAPAFSEFGYSGLAAGAGSTEAQRWDNSVRYSYRQGGFRLQAMYSNGGWDTGMLGTGYGGEVGMTLEGLSVDVVYEHENGAVSLRSSFNDSAHPVPSPGLAAYVSTDESWNVMGRYEIGIAQDKFTIYAGYSHIQKSYYDYTGGESVGGYPLDVDININNPLVYDFEWAGARYAYSSGLNLVVGLYHATQNSYTIGHGATGTQGIGCAASGSLCAGDFTEVSFLVDYIFNKHYDLYAGVNYSEVTDGLAFGYPGTTVGTSGSQNQITLMFGGRIKF
ncbi:MAG TPA: porin [Steroidobacteraceae bacterium]|jgi:predicted porin|nr:porin [Steroidobacteraceae bacterium]